MFRKMLGVFTAVLAALVVAGVAWASSDSSTATTLPEETSSTSTVDGSSSTSLASSTSTSFDDSTTSTSSTSPTTPSTTVPANTATTVDDHGGDDDDDKGAGTTSTTIDDHGDDGAVLADGTYQYLVADAGTVTIEVNGGKLSLSAVSVNSGWSYYVEEDHTDEIEVEFTKGEAEAGIEVKIENGKLEVEIESKKS